MLKIAATFCAALIAVSAFSTFAEARHGGFGGGGARMGGFGGGGMRMGGFAGPRFGAARFGGARMGFAGPGRMGFAGPGRIELSDRAHVGRQSWLGRQRCLGRRGGQDRWAGNRWGAGVVDAGGLGGVWVLVPSRWLRRGRTTAAATVTTLVSSGCPIMAG